MKKVSAKTLNMVGWAVIVLCFIGGIVMGAVFRREDVNINGVPTMVFDIWLMFITWLLGGVLGVILIGKSLGRK